MWDIASNVTSLQELIVVPAFSSIMLFADLLFKYTVCPIQKSSEKHRHRNQDVLKRRRVCECAGICLSLVCLVLNARLLVWLWCNFRLTAPFLLMLGDQCMPPVPKFTALLLICKKFVMTG